MRVPAPSFALVYISTSSLSGTSATQTFATTSVTRLMNTATVDPAVLATSNGHVGLDFLQGYGSTSPQTGNNTRTLVLPSLAVLGAMVASAIILMKAFARAG